MCTWIYLKDNVRALSKSKPLIIDQLVGFLVVESTYSCSSPRLWHECTADRWPAAQQRWYGEGGTGGAGRGREGDRVDGRGS